MIDKAEKFQGDMGIKRTEDRYLVPKVIHSGDITTPRELNIGKVLRAHVRILSNMTPDFAEARPLVLLRTSMSYNPTVSSTDSKVAASLQYDALERQLADIGASEDNLPGVEEGAVRTAKDVIAHIRAASLAPPSLSSLGPEALVMLWVLGNTKYALTITDGELGYVVRRSKETVIRKSELKIDDLDVLLLEDKR